MQKIISTSLSSGGRCTRRVRGADLVAVFAALVFLCGCAGQSYQRAESALPELDHPPIVLLMKPDVQLSELTAGGMLEPHAQWTEAGLGNVEQALADLMRSREAAMIPYVPPADLDQLSRDDQIIKLHRVVGFSITLHKYNEFLLLPTKQEVFDWTLGPDVQQLATDYKADYALFIFLRDSYATAGRQAVMATMALFGVGVTGGTQTGFASLVNLRTGDVVWFNRLFRATGDLRTPEPAKEAIDALLAGFPL